MFPLFVRHHCGGRQLTGPGAMTVDVLYFTFAYDVTVSNL